MVAKHERVLGLAQEEDVDVETQPLMQPSNTRRKSSISEALNKFTAQPFHRRRLTADLTSSTSSTNLLPASRLPTPAGISRSSSFFRNLNAFNSKPADLSGKDKPATSVTVKRTPRFWGSSSSTASSSQPSAEKGKPSTPHPGDKKAGHSASISQHKLMAPIPPGVPRSVTMGNLNQQTSSPRNPSFMRPTSSSAARRQSLSSGLGHPTSIRQPRSSIDQVFDIQNDTTTLLPHSTGDRQLRSVPHSSIGQAANTHKETFPLSPAKEEEEEIEYATDEEIEIGVARTMTITPVRSVSSHNPFSDNNFAYGIPNKHDKSKRDSGKPFEHLLARPVHINSTPRRDSKPLPRLTPDTSRAVQYGFGSSSEVPQLATYSPGDHLPRSYSRAPLQPTPENKKEEAFKPEDVYFAEDIGEDEYEEGDTVIHTVQGQGVKGSFASASTSEAASEPASEPEKPLLKKEDNDLTTSTITPAGEENTQKVSTAPYSRPQDPPLLPTQRIISLPALSPPSPPLPSSFPQELPL